MVAIALTAAPQEPQPTLTIPADAVRWVVADLGTLPTADRPFQRYVWITDWMTGDDIAAVKLAANVAFNHSSEPQPCDVVADGRLVRIDLRKFEPDPEDLLKLLATYERLGDEGWFHATRTVRFVRGKKRFRKRIFAYRADDPRATTAMLSASGSNAVLLRADHFIEKTLGTIDGGLYYQFAKTQKSDKKQTAENKWLKKFGSNEKLVEKLDGKNRAGVLVSGVTEKPRRVDVFRGLAGRGTGIISITHDITDEDFQKVDSDPIRNLLNFKDAAREAIALRPNGFQAFALFDGKGELQNEVPPNVAKDHELGSAGTARLQGAVSCIRCHGRRPEDGYRTVTNDIREMFADREYDLAGDFSDLGLTLAEARDKLRGDYLGDLDAKLDDARNEANKAVMLATGVDYSTAAECLAKNQATYREHVTARIACRDLGYDVPDDQAVELFRSLVGDIPSVGGLIPEDPYILALKKKRTIHPRNWQQVYGDAVRRMLRNKPALPAKDKQSVRLPGLNKPVGRSFTGGCLTQKGMVAA